MNEMIRRPSDFSPKSSPRGSRSPVVPRQDSTGTLKTTISLGKAGPAIVHSGPFYLMKAEPPGESELTGSTNLIVHHNLEHSFNKLCSSGKRHKDQLSAFLQNLPGNIDIATDEHGPDSLRNLIEKPPIGGKELTPLGPSQLVGFRLHVGALPEKYREHLSVIKKRKHKKSKHKGSGDVTPPHEGSQVGELSAHEKTPKHGKKRKHDEDKERKKKKKEKKRKKQKYSPDPSGGPALGSDRSV